MLAPSPIDVSVDSLRGEVDALRTALRADTGRRRALAGAVASLRRELAAMRNELRGSGGHYVDSGLIFPSLQSIAAAVCAHYEMVPHELRLRTDGIARHAVCHLARRLTRHSTPTIARYLGYAEHSGVLYGDRRIARMRQKNQTLNATLARIETKLLTPTTEATESTRDCTEGTPQ
jgi:hypothetical protein